MEANFLDYGLSASQITNMCLAWVPGEGVNMC